MLGTEQNTSLHSIHLRTSKLKMGLLQNGVTVSRSAGSATVGHGLRISRIVQLSDEAKQTGCLADTTELDAKRLHLDEYVLQMKNIQVQ